MQLYHREGLPILVAPSLLGYSGVVHGCSTRQGGVSQGPFATLNLGVHTSDNPQSVLENRARFAAALNVRPQDLVVPRQSHGVCVAVVDSRSGSTVEADALITRAPGLVLSVTVADCVPVLLYDSVTRVAAAIHAGWKGTTGGIVHATLQQMRSCFGTRPEDCCAAIGPSIGPCCYVTDERRALCFPPEVVEHAGNCRYRIDLGAANRKQLLEAGVPASRVNSASGCTSCQPDLFFSHRRDGSRAGRMMATIGIRNVAEQDP